MTAEAYLRRTGKTPAQAGLQTKQYTYQGKMFEGVVARLLPEGEFELHNDDVNKLELEEELDDGHQARGPL